MKKIIITILIGIGLLIASNLSAARFDWSLGQPTVVLDNTAGTSSDSVWWVLGQPVPVASTTVAIVEPPVGTNMKVNIGDSWKVVEGVWINIGDSWKVVAGMQENIGDTWKTIY